jgi:hypothetical protein
VSELDLASFVRWNELLDECDGGGGVVDRGGGDDGG